MSSLLPLSLGQLLLWPLYIQLSSNDQQKDLIFPEMIVWDFDCTITRVPLCANGIQIVPPQSSLDAIIADPVFFRESVMVYLQAGGKVAIASYSSKPLILQTMQRLFAPDPCPFTEVNVCTPNDLPGGRDTKQGPRGGKKAMLDELVSRLHCVTRAILLIDDNEDHVRDVIRGGYMGICVPTYPAIPPTCRGFTREMVQVLHQNGIRFPS